MGEVQRGKAGRSVKRLETVLTSCNAGMNYGRSSEHGEERKNHGIFGENNNGTQWKHGLERGKSNDH